MGCILQLMLSLESYQPGSSCHCSHLYEFGWFYCWDNWIIAACHQTIWGRARVKTFKDHLREEKSLGFCLKFFFFWLPPCKIAPASKFAELVSGVWKKIMGIKMEPYFKRCIAYSGKFIASPVLLATLLNLNLIMRKQSDKSRL